MRLKLTAHLNPEINTSDLGSMFSKTERQQNYFLKLLPYQKYLTLNPEIDFQIQIRLQALTRNIT